MYYKKTPRRQLFDINNINSDTNREGEISTAHNLKLEHMSRAKLSMALCLFQASKTEP